MRIRGYVGLSAVHGNSLSRSTDPNSTYYAQSLLPSFGRSMRTVRSKMSGQTFKPSATLTVHSNFSFHASVTVNWTCDLSRSIWTPRRPGLGFGGIIHWDGARLSFPIANNHIRETTTKIQNIFATAPFGSSNITYEVAPASCPRIGASCAPARIVRAERITLRIHAQRRLRHPCRTAPRRRGRAIATYMSRKGAENTGSEVRCQNLSGVW